MINKLKSLWQKWQAHRELMRKMDDLIDPTFLDRATQGDK